ncbi:hypothetical protein BDF14DRAFT_1774244 [Spinellus fusiger]|nr:hypothetical protein BDF14DRAFT_1774244 [Spinellus fusiger]
MRQKDLFMLLLALPALNAAVMDRGEHQGVGSSNLFGHNDFTDMKLSDTGSSRATYSNSQESRHPSSVSPPLIEKEIVNDGISSIDDSSLSIPTVENDDAEISETSKEASIPEVKENISEDAESNKEIPTLVVEDTTEFTEPNEEVPIPVVKDDTTEVAESNEDTVPKIAETNEEPIVPVVEDNVLDITEKTDKSADKETPDEVQDSTTVSDPSNSPKEKSRSRSKKGQTLDNQNNSTRTKKHSPKRKKHIKEINRLTKSKDKLSNNILDRLRDYSASTPATDLPKKVKPRPVSDSKSSSIKKTNDDNDVVEAFIRGYMSAPDRRLENAYSSFMDTLISLFKFSIHEARISGDYPYKNQTGTYLEELVNNPAVAIIREINTVMPISPAMTIIKVVASIRELQSEAEQAMDSINDIRLDVNHMQEGSVNFSTKITQAVELMFKKPKEAAIMMGLGGERFVKEFLKGEAVSALENMFSDVVDPSKDMINNVIRLSDIIIAGNKSLEPLKEVFNALRGTLVTLSQKPPLSIKAEIWVLRKTVQITRDRVNAQIRQHIS